MHFVSAILAGGDSSRFGADKALADIAGAPMIAHVARALGGESLAVVGHLRAATLLRAAVLSDPADAVRGPLAGVLAALDWARQSGADWVVTAPCDVPLLPAGMGETLIAAASGASAAYALTEDGAHALCAAWRPALAESLRAAFARGVHPPVRALAADAVAVRFADAEAFLNVNTKADLARALRRVARDHD